MKRRTTTRQQILAALAAMAPPDLTPEQEAAARRVAEAAERRIHEKAVAKEIAERRRLLNLVFRGADANIRALAGRGPRDEDLIARAHEAALELQRRWRSDPKRSPTTADETRRRGNAGRRRSPQPTPRRTRAARHAPPATPGRARRVDPLELIPSIVSGAMEHGREWPTN